MAVSYDFIDDGTSFLINQMDGATQLSSRRFAKKDTVVKVKDGLIHIWGRGDNKPFVIARELMTPSQVDDDAAITFIQTLIFT